MTTTARAIEAKVYYWKDIHYLVRFSFAFTPEQIKAALPTREQFENDYALVATIDTQCGSIEGIPEYLFNELNIHPETYFDPTAYSKGVKHTSMSVGDIVVIGGDMAYICLAAGWQAITFRS